MVKFGIRFLRQVVSWFSRLNLFAPLVARITLAQVFIESGWGKMHNIPKVVEFFTSLGIPAPHFQALLVSATEFGCGTLLLLGLGTRLAALPLSATMVVALLTARRAEISSFSDLTAMIEYLYLALLFFLITAGPGFISLDRWIVRMTRKIKTE